MRARSIFFSSLLFCVCLQQSQSAINWSLIAFIPKVTYEVVELLLKANKIIGPYSTSIPHPLFDKAEHYLFARLEVITDKLDYLSTSHEGRESTVGQLVRNLPQRLRLELHLNDLLDYTTRVNVNYRRMHLYVHEKDEIEKDTLVDFAENVISHDSSSVVNLLERMYAFVVPHEKGIGDTGLLPALAKSLTKIYVQGPPKPPNLLIFVVFMEPEPPEIFFMKPEPEPIQKFSLEPKPESKPLIKYFG